MSIRIYNPEELPYGLLSNNFEYKMTIDGEEWDNVTQFIYTNLIPKENEYFRRTMKSLNYYEMPKKYVEFESIIKDDFIKDILKKALESRFQDPGMKEYLLSTGNSRMFYINAQNLFFGTTKNLIPQLKQNIFIESKNILGQVFEEIRNKLQEHFIDTKIFEQYIKFFMLSEVVVSKLKKVMTLATSGISSNKKRLDEFIKDEYDGGFQEARKHINFDQYKKLIKTDDLLKQVLILSQKNPLILIQYAISKNIGKCSDKHQQYIKKIVFEVYLSNFEKQKSLNRNDIKNELKQINVSYLEEILFNIYISNKFPKQLNDEIANEIHNMDLYLPSEKEINSYEKFNINLFPQEYYEDDDEDDGSFKLQLTMLNDNRDSDFLFTDSDEALSIFVLENIKIDNIVYDNIQNYLQNQTFSNDIFNQDKRIEKIKYLCNLSLNKKFRFVLMDDKKMERSNMDFHHVLNLVKEKQLNIIHLDEIELISTFTSEYLNYHKDNSLRVDLIHNIYNVNVDKSFQSFIEEDVFMSKFIELFIKNICNAISNMYFFVKDKYNQNFVIDLEFVKNIYNKMFLKSSNKFEEKYDDENDDVLIPDKYLEQINFHLKLLKCHDNIKTQVWKFISNDLKYLWETVIITDESTESEKSSKHFEIKNVIANIQMNLSNSFSNEYMIVDNFFENSIIHCVISLFDEINNISKEYADFYYIFDVFNEELKLLDIYKRDVSSLKQFINILQVNTKNNFIKNKILQAILSDYNNKSNITKFDMDNVVGLILNVNTHKVNKREVRNKREYLTAENITANESYENNNNNEDNEIENDYEKAYSDFEQQKLNQQRSLYEDNNNTKQNKMYDNDDNDEYMNQYRSNFNDEEGEGDDDENDGGIGNNFEQDRVKSLVKSYLITNNIPPSIKAEDVINLCSFVKMNTTSEMITMNRCNFFKKQKRLSKHDFIGKKEKKEKKEISISSSCDISKSVVNVNGIKGGSTASETWVLELNDKKHQQMVFCKLFINTDNNLFELDKLNFYKSEIKDGFYLSSKSLSYEMKIYNEIVGPLKRLKVCKHFIPLISTAESCDYKSILEILKNNVIDDDKKIKMDDLAVDYVLKRNINEGIINMNNKLTINQNPPHANESNPNQDEIETSMKYSLLLTKFFDFTKGFTLTYFLSNYFQSRDVMLQVLFQVCVVCYVMSLSKMTHNDLHGDNIFVKKMNEMKTFVYYINDQRYEIKTFFKVYIFDFNFSYVEKLGKNEGINDHLCDNFNVCNQFVENKDVLKVLCAFYKFYPDCIKYCSSKQEDKEQLKQLYVDKECFFRDNMGKTASSDFFKKFNNTLNILKSVYIEIPQNDFETIKSSDQKIGIIDGKEDKEDSVLETSFINEKNFQDDGLLLKEKHVDDMLELSRRDVINMKGEDEEIKEEINDDEIKDDMDIEKIINNSINNNHLQRKNDEKEVNDGDDEIDIEKIINNSISINNLKKNKEEKEEKEEDEKEVNEEENDKEDGVEKEDEIVVNEKEDEEPENEEEPVKQFLENDSIKLISDGYVIFEGSSGNKLENFFNEQTEFKKNKPLIFSKYQYHFSHPSSFHHKEIRKIRRNIYKQLLNHFKKFYPKQYIEMLFGNLYILKKGSNCISFDKILPNIKNDIMINGWINLSDTAQVFSYKKLGPDNNIEIKEEIVKPKNIVLFNINSIEETKLNYNNGEDQYRLYFTFHVSENKTPLHDNENVIENLGVPIIANGKKPEMYSDRHLTQWSSRLKHFSKKIEPSFLKDGMVTKIFGNLKETDSSKINPKIKYEEYNNLDKSVSSLILL